MIFSVHDLHEAQDPQSMRSSSLSHGGKPGAFSGQQRQRNRRSSSPSLGLAALSLCAWMSGCQGIDWGNTDDSPTPTQEPEPIVTPTALPNQDPVDQSKLDLSGGPVYFKLKDGSTPTVTSPSSSTDWDLVFDGHNIHINGGQSGPGKGWGLGPVGTGESDYEALTNHNDVVGPVVYYDEFASVLTDWYVYLVSGNTHGLYSRFHVYAVQVDATHIYKVQLEDYYALVNNSLESGMITFRWADVDSDTPAEELVDARAGGAHAEEGDPANKFTYFSFETGSVVDLTDEEAATSMAWDIAFKRYDIKLNGGVSGPKGVVGYDFQAGREETDNEVKAFTPESELPEFEAASTDTIAGPWTSDRIGSIMEGNYVIDGESVEPSNGVYVVSDASDSTYYKFLVTDVTQGTDGSVSSVTFRSSEIF